MEIQAKLVMAAKKGDEAAMTAVLGCFEGYIKKWALKELKTFLGTWMDLQDIENLLRERVWVAMKKYSPRKHKSFYNRAIGYMRGGLWATRNEMHRRIRMQKQPNPSQAPITKKRRVRVNQHSAKLVLVEAPAPKTVSSVTHSFSSLMDNAKGDHFEVARLIAALRVEIDFDFEIFLEELHDELAKRDPFLPGIFKMLYQGFGLEEIADFIGTTGERIGQLIQNEVIPVAAIVRAEELALAAHSAGGMVL